jgi:replicative DNA helicase
MNKLTLSPSQLPFAEPEMEWTLLGSVLTSVDAWDATSDLLDPRIFTGPVRPVILDTVAAFYREGIPVDEQGVLAALESRRELDGLPVAAEVWGATARRTLVPEILRHYASVLRDLWAQRQARALLADVLNRGRVASAEVTIGELQRELAKIETGRGGAIVGIGELLLLFQDQLEAESQGKPGTEAVSTGFTGVDQVVGGFEPGILQFYAARPGVGKSALATAFSAALGGRGEPAAVFWLEDTARMFALRTAAYVGEIPVQVLRHGTRMRAPWWDRLAAASETVSRWPLYVESAKGLTGAQLAQRMRRLRREKGVRVFLTDHLGEMKLDRDEYGARTDLALGEVARQYRDEAERLGACPVAFHQLGRTAESERGAPRLGWLFNSDILGQAGRVVAFLTQEGRTVKLNFVKTTYAAAGSTVELGWDPETMRIFEPQPTLPGAA